MNASLLLRLLFQGVLLFSALCWEVKMPKTIHGLKGSCLVIPCSFSFTLHPPTKPNRVVWYQWVSRGYPLVCDPSNANKVIDKFRGKTDLYGNSSGACSLLIRNLEQSHHGEKIYAWIDPENVGWRTFAFYDVTSTIFVDVSAQPPSISISGGEKIGDKIRVTCSASHACPYSKPNITLNGIEGSDQTNGECNEDGQCRITLTRSAVIKAENTTFECSVTHHGGTTVTATKRQSSECVHQKITIEPEIADVTEDVEQNFTCTVHHFCQKENPTITWNYENMQVSEGTKTLSDFDRVAYSTITFLGAKEDHGRKLICSAAFSGGNITASVVLYLQHAMLDVLKTTGLYILTPSLVFLLACVLAVVIICKRQRRSKDTSTVPGNKPFKPYMPSPKSEPKSRRGSNDYEANYNNMEELDIYENDR
ncbi:uncharacterized protein [Danio rerio]|uniref:Ig-like domain-containing protein n=1 Tax=Danio rerio TaxID=7955 RepID=A0AB32T780_DANRE